MLVKGQIWLIALIDPLLDASIEVNILGGFAFSRCAILAFRELEINELGYRGCLIFTYVLSLSPPHPIQS